MEFSERDSHADHGLRAEVAPGKLGAIASESAICSQHGVDILKMGGNAADAVSLSWFLEHILRIGADNGAVGCH